MTDLRTSLVGFGADRAAVHLLNEDRPELLRYATLTTGRRNGDTTLDGVEAVCEWQGEPLVFVVGANSRRSQDHLHRIRRVLAMRGDAPYLAVAGPGHLKVYSVALDRKSLTQAHVDWRNGVDSQPAVLPWLGNMRPKAAIANRHWISSVVLNLLSGTTSTLIELDVSDENAISLVGRALFTRFLADRNLLPPTRSEPGRAARLFDTREAARKTSKWLDATFNGDLLPLSDDTFDRLNEDGYRVLGNILRRAPDSQLFLGWEEKWDNLDFAHIPVGVLSQAYELYLKEHAPKRQRREGGYFTPRPIADLMVQASLRALSRRKKAETAKVLDPAVGGGMFLLTAFRELVAERWRAENQRPDTKTLRQILYNQLVGFDINEAALRFAALGLYLLAIELDPNPRPIDNLRFDDLRGMVLHRVKTEDELEGKELGSLGPLVGEEHVGRYDVVIGNPPWTSGTKLPGWDLVRATVSRIAARREIGNTSPPLPNEGLDLPFVWRATEWAKPDGQIAFALHARLLFQHGDGMPAARRALFETLDVTSVINGAELRQTKVWPQISAPFCILFATNRKPGVETGFRFISPRIEERLNATGSMRIDVRNADIVSTRELLKTETPEILKILFRGTKADLGIVKRIRMQSHPTLAEFWGTRIGRKKGHLRGSGNGYQRRRPSSRVRQQGDDLPGADARYLHGLPNITVASFANILVETKSLRTFQDERIHDPRSRELFVGPLVVIHKSPPAATKRIGVTISEKDVVYNQTFYGYSPSGDPDAELLVRYLALVLGSKVTLWWALMTSGGFGFERDVIEKATLDRMPIPDFNNLTTDQREKIAELVEGLQSGEKSWEDVDNWIVRLYGLGKQDWQIISDTLEFGLPFAKNKKEAQSIPTSLEKERFVKVLRSELSPWCERFGSALAVDQIPPLARSPWQVIRVRTGAPKALGESMESVPESDWVRLLNAADQAASSEIFVDKGRDGLLIGRLAQRRYWSETQARLLAQRIIWSHVELLEGQAQG